MNELVLSRNLPYIIYNRGVGGDQIHELIADIDTLIYDLKPSKLFINIGSNDIGGQAYDKIFNVLLPYFG